MTATTVRHDPAAGLRPHLPALLSLAGASCLAVTTEMLPVGLLPAIGRAFAVNDSLAGLLVTLYAVMVAVLAVPLTIATTRFGRKPLLLMTLLGYVLSNALVAVAPVFAVVAVGRGLGGITHALFFSLCIGYVPRVVPAASVGRALTIVTGGASAGFGLGVPHSTSLGTAVGWRAAFAVLAVLAAVTLALVAKLLPAIPNGTRSKAAARGRGELAAVVASNGLTYLGQFTLYTFISLLALRAGLRESLIGPLLLVCGACGLIGLAYTAKTLDRSPRRTAILILGVVVVAVLGVAIGYPALIALVVLAAVWNGAFGGVPSIYQACAVRTKAVSPEMAGAWVNASANVGIGGGAAIGAGLLPVVGLGGLPWAAAGLLTAGLAVVICARRAFPDRP